MTRIEVCSEAGRQEEHKRRELSEVGTGSYRES